MIKMKKKLFWIVEISVFIVLTGIVFFVLAWLEPMKCVKNLFRTAFPILLIMYFFIFLSFKILEYYYYQLLNQKILIEKLNKNLLDLSSKLSIDSFLESGLKILVEFCKGNKGIFFIIDDKLKKYLKNELIAVNTEPVDSQSKNLKNGYRMLVFSSGDITAEIEDKIKGFMKLYDFQNSNSVMVVPISDKNRVQVVGIIGTSFANKQSARMFNDMQDVMEIFIKQLNVSLENSILHEDIKEASIKDPLTNLYNKRFFNSKKKEEFAKARRMGFPISIMLSDLDNFKNCIDAHGHLAGDTLLTEAAKVITSALREGDTVCRFGGDEFSYILPFTSSKEAKVVAERIRKIVSKHPFLKEENGNFVNLTISIGIATFPEHGETEKDVLSKADHSLFLSKNKGKNTITIYKESKKV